MTHGGWSKLRGATKEKIFVNSRTECSVRQVAVSCCYRIIWLTEFPFIMPTVLYFALACDHMHKLFSYVFCRDWTQKPRCITKDLSNIARGKRNGCRAKKVVGHFTKACKSLGKHRELETCFMEAPLEGNGEVMRFPKLCVSPWKVHYQALTETSLTNSSAFELRLIPAPDVFIEDYVCRRVTIYGA